jgi:uncharacterized pyridoxamine 5'-phosphate oxidase family protein
MFVVGTTFLSEERNRDPPENAKLSVFWTQLPNAAIENKILKFGSNNPLDPDDADRLFVRQDYEDLWELMCNYHRTKRTRTFIVTGTPGIGKSFFLFYILWQLSKDPIARAAGIMYTTKDGTYFIFSDTGVFQTRVASSPQIEMVSSNSNAWWLMDGREQGFFSLSRCKLVLAATPSIKENYNELSKKFKHTRLWMPVWDLGAESDKFGISPELDQLRRELYPDTTFESMVAAVRRWGPVPRYVLQQVNQNSAQEQLTDAIEKSSYLSDLRSLLEGSILSVPEALSHKALIPVVNRTDFLVTDYAVASNYVTEIIATRLSNADKKYESWLRICEKITTLDTAWGKFFAYSFQKRLMDDGGDFPCQELFRIGDTSPSSTADVSNHAAGGELVSIPPIHRENVLFFGSADELSNLDVSRDSLWCPLAANFPALDCLVVSGGSIYLFQCTKSAEHGYSYDGISTVWKHLRHVRKHIKGVYLVVSNTGTYGAVKWQPLTGVNAKPRKVTGKVAKDRWPKGLRQWKLCFIHFKARRLLRRKNLPNNISSVPVCAHILQRKLLPIVLETS